jgi:hypothetical protein
MKRRFRMLPLALVAVLAFSAIAAAAAQAHEWSIVNGKNKVGTEISGTHTLAELELASETVSSSGGPFTLSSFIGTTAIMVECATEENTGTIIKGGTDTATITFKTCKLTKPTPNVCTVPNITATTKTELITVGTKLYDEFLPEVAGGKFATLKIEGAECSLKGSYEVKGSTAGYDSASATNQEKHTLVFSSTVSSEAGTALTLGTKAATLTGSSVEKLSGANLNKSWSGV